MLQAFQQDTVLVCQSPLDGCEVISLVEFWTLGEQAVQILAGVVCNQSGAAALDDQSPNTAGRNPSRGTSLLSIVDRKECKLIIRPCGKLIWQNHGAPVLLQCPTSLRLCPR